MAQREELRAELLELIETNKEGFAALTPATQRIDALIDELVQVTKYPGALNHTDVFKGHWAGIYFSFGRLVGGDGATNQGAGVTASLRVFSMGRLPDVPATQVYSGLEIEPESGAYNFYARYKIGKNKIDSHHLTYGRYSRKEENPDRFFVEFDKFEILPADPDMSLEDYRNAIGAASTDKLSATLSPSPKLWSHVAYMDDEIRIHLGQMGGHYVMRKTALPMYALEHAAGKTIAPQIEAVA
jgi:hypothetical protein